MHTSFLGKFLSQHRGSAVIIALIVVILLTIMSTTFLEKILSFSRSSEGIENSNRAYYLALGAIEQSLFTGGVSKYTPWNISDTSVGEQTTLGTLLTVTTGGMIIPKPGLGNSPYDPDWNTLSLGDPVQLVIDQGIDWVDVKFQFRIPKIDARSSTGIHISTTNSGYILWTLSYSSGSLFASGETNTFLGSDINGNQQTIATKSGVSNKGIGYTFNDFYTSPIALGPSGQECALYKCTLKLSLLSPLSTDDDPTLNHKITSIEYKISELTTSIPQEYMYIKASGYAYGFMRSRVLKLPQITTNSALDFAVLQ